MPPGFPALEFEALIARLASDPRSLTVLTPNHRLAQALLRATDARHLAAGAGSWEAPDILHWSGWLQRCHEEASFSGAAGGVPGLAGEEEAQLLWEDAVRASRWSSELPSTPAFAALAAEAWALAHAWALEGQLAAFPGNEDVEAFHAWRAHYEARTAAGNLTDAARLPGHVAAWLESGVLARPETLVLHAFDLVTPQQASLFRRCAAAGIEVLACAPPHVEAAVQRVELESPRRELEVAARWARAQLERASAAGRSSPRIAVIVPRLAERRAEAERIFARAFAAGAGGEGGAYVNLSAGESLAARALADAALAIIEFALGPVDFDRVSRLLRSPFLAGAEGERLHRARLDAALRRLAPARLTLRRLRSLLGAAYARRGAPQCPLFAERLDALVAHAADTGRATPRVWARRFSSFLDAMGWPGERALDSAEYQTLEKFRETLRAFAGLGTVAPAWDAGEARACLRRLVEQTVFQPASGEAAVQVLGILESAGLAFDHLWVSGLTEEDWPIAPRLHPLIPAALQKRAGIPQASAERSLEVDRALTEAWKSAAPEVVFSSARADGDRLLLASPLVATIPATPEAALAVPDYPTLGGALFAAKKGALGERKDAVAPPLGDEAAQGGTGILADQAACAFRAFAHYRLDARGLDRPEPGLGPPERGQLLHTMMAHLWRQLRDQATLAATAPAELDAAVKAAAAEAMKKLRADRPGAIDGRFEALEAARLERLAHEWLALERTRRPFTVVFREETMTLSAGNLRLRGRVDRMDRLEEGGLAVIDYKSGQASVASWFGDRPDDVQLPLYALAAEEDVSAVAFARLKVGELRFLGVARDEGLLPDVPSVAAERSAKKAGTWEKLLDLWRDNIARLGEDFASGDAAVDPKRLLVTCERCDLKPLCRVHERLGALAEAEEPLDEDESE